MIGGTSCAACYVDLKSKSTLIKGNRYACVVCSRQFCTDCIADVRELVISPQHHYSVTVCKATCVTFINRLQVELDPWFNCRPSSVALSTSEAALSAELNQLYSRLSNYDGLVRFFVENKDRVPRADMVGPLHDLEESIRAGVATLTRIQKEINGIVCPPFPQHRDEHVKRGLANFATYHLTKVKAQFSLSCKLYEQLLRVRGFSPRSLSPRPSPPLTPPRAGQREPPETDLASL